MEDRKFIGLMLKRIKFKSNEQNKNFVCYDAILRFNSIYDMDYQKMHHPEDVERYKNENSSHVTMLMNIFDIWNTLQELKIIPSLITKSFLENQEILYNYHCKNYCIRCSAIIDACLELINYTYNFKLTKRECTISHVSRILRENKIKSNAFQIVYEFNNKNYESIVQPKNDIIHRCKLRFDFLEVLNDIMLNTPVVEKSVEEHMKSVENNNKEFMQKQEEILNNNISIMDEFLNNFLENLFKEYKNVY